MGLPVSTDYAFVIQTDVFHTDVPDRLTKLFSTESFKEDGTNDKEEWFNDYHPGLDELAVLKAKFKFNRFKLVCKCYEISSWRENNSKCAVDYTFLLHTDRSVVEYEEIEEKIMAFKTKCIEQYKIPQK
jgi:hypothetical protein